jgi:hypothetical protein
VLHVLNLIGFGYIARLSQLGGGRVISSFKLLLPAFATRRGKGEGVRSLCTLQYVVASGTCSIFNKSLAIKSLAYEFIGKYTF